jgi:sensor histidine kinase regulating citrate/malate metabolism
MTFSIRTKVIGLVLLGVAIVTIVVGFSVAYAFARNKQTIARQSLGAAHAAYQGLVNGDVSKLGATGVTLLNSTALVQAFAERDRARLQQEAERVYPELVKEFGVTHLNFILPDRKIFLRMTKPQQHGDVVERVTLRNAIETGKLSAGLELGKTGFVLRTVRPITTPTGTIGYLELGEEISQFASRLKAQTGFDLGVLLTKAGLNKADWASTRAALKLPDNWDARAGVVVAQSTLSNEDMLLYQAELDALPPEGLVLEQVRTEQTTHMRGIFPISDAAGKTAGAIVVLTDITDLGRSVESAQRTSLLVTMSLGLILSLTVWLLLDRLVFRRLAVMADHLEELSLRVAGGDFDIEAGLEADPRKDEIGRLEQFLAQFLALIGGTLKSLCGSGNQS